jgi:hypothetical protein
VIVKRKLAVSVVCLVVMCAAQEAAPPPASAKGATVIGCLSGPDADDHYTLTSMQHRLGVEVVGDDTLKQGAGSKVKLTGSWEALPGANAKSGDAGKRFKATGVTVMEEKCAAPQAVTPVSKKKQAQQKKSPVASRQ